MIGADGKTRTSCRDVIAQINAGSMTDEPLAQMRNPWGQSDFVGTFNHDVKDNSGRFVMTKTEFFQQVDEVNVSLMDMDRAANGDDAIKPENMFWQDGNVPVRFRYLEAGKMKNMRGATGFDKAAGKLRAYMVPHFEKLIAGTEHSKWYKFWCWGKDARCVNK